MTTVGVAVVAHAITDLPWAQAFVLGAVVSPTDPIAATAIGRRLGVPRRLIDIIEGESLVNDGTALVLLRTAIVAAVAGSFSPWDAGGRLVLNIVGGIAVGLAVGYVIRRVRRALDNPPLEVTIAFLTGYFAFLPASALGVSGVLAVVTAGVYMGWYTPELTTVQTRLQGRGFWEILTFLLNVLLFGLVGLQLRPILDALSGRGGWSLVGDAAVIVLAVIVVRIVWVFPATYLPRWLIPRAARARSVAAVEVSGVHLLERHARSRDDRGGAAHPAAHGRRRAVSRPRPDHLLRVRRRARDARRAGPVAAAADPRAADWRRTTAVPRPRRRTRASARPRRRSSASTSWSARRGCWTTRPSGSAASTGSGSTASRRASIPTATARSRSGR